MGNLAGKVRLTKLEANPGSFALLVLQQTSLSVPLGYAVCQPKDWAVAPDLAGPLPLLLTRVLCA